MNSNDENFKWRKWFVGFEQPMKPVSYNVLTLWRGVQSVEAVGAMIFFFSYWTQVHEWIWHVRMWDVWIFAHNKFKALFRNKFDPQWKRVTILLCLILYYIDSFILKFLDPTNSQLENISIHYSLLYLKKFSHSQEVRVANDFWSYKSSKNCGRSRL